MRHSMFSCDLNAALSKCVMTSGTVHTFMDWMIFFLLIGLLLFVTLGLCYLVFLTALGILDARECLKTVKKDKA
jgi:hypothetical protein